MNSATLLVQLFVLLVFIDSIRRSEKEERKVSVLFIAILYPLVLAYIYFENNNLARNILLGLIFVVLVWELWKSWQLMNPEKIIKMKMFDKARGINILTGFLFGPLMLFWWHLSGNPFFIILGMLYFLISIFEVSRRIVELTLTFGILFILIGAYASTSHDLLITIFGVWMILYGVMIFRVTKEVKKWKREALNS